MSKRQTIRLRPADITIKRQGSGELCMEITGWRGENSPTETRIYVTMETWWVKYIADELHGYIQTRQKELNECLERLRQ